MYSYTQMIPYKRGYGCTLHILVFTDPLCTLHPHCTLCYINTLTCTAQTFENVSREIFLERNTYTNARQPIWTG